jgi:ketosteroid isomerase-like protein
MKSRLLLLAVPVAVMLTACQPGITPLSDEDVAAIRAFGPAIDDVALSGNWSAFPEMFTEDGILMPANGPLYQVRSEFGAIIESLGMTMREHTIEFVDIDGSGDIAYGRATYSETYNVAGVSEPIDDTGKILAIFRKQPDGSWLISTWIYNSDLPLPTSEGEHSDGEEHS